MCVLVGRFLYCPFQTSSTHGACLNGYDILRKKFIGWIKKTLKVVFCCTAGRAFEAHIVYTSRAPSHSLCGAWDILRYVSRRSILRSIYSVFDYYRSESCTLMVYECPSNHKYQNESFILPAVGFSLHHASLAPLRLALGFCSRHPDKTINKANDDETRRLGNDVGTARRSDDRCCTY